MPVTVNDHPLQFMLDTGSTEAVIWKQALPGVATINNVQVHGIRPNGTGRLFDWCRVRELKLGSLSLPDVAMAVDVGLVGHKTLSGFLGGNILEDFVVTVDYTKKQVILACSFDKNSSKNTIMVPMRIRNHRPFCSVNLDGKLEVPALLDTGSPSNMAAESLLEPILKKKLYFWIRTSGPWMGNLSGDKVKLKSIEPGGNNFKEPVFDVFRASDAPAAATSIMLGNSYLSGFKSVTFDYPARQVFFEPAETSSKSAGALRDEGEFQLYYGKVQQAEEAFSQSIILDKELAGLCYPLRAEAYMNLKQYRKALEDIIEAIKLDPTHAKNYRIRAWAYEKLGKYQLARRDRKMAKLHSRP